MAGVFGAFRRTLTKLHLADPFPNHGIKTGFKDITLYWKGMAGWSRKSLKIYPELYIVHGLTFGGLVCSAIYLAWMSAYEDTGMLKIGTTPLTDVKANQDTKLVFVTVPGVGDLSARRPELPAYSASNNSIDALNGLQVGTVVSAAEDD